MLELAETPFRYHEFLYEYWNKLSGARPFPLMNEVDMLALEKVTSYCFVVELGSGDGNEGFRYLHRGVNISVTEGEDAEAVEFLFANPRTPFDIVLNQVVSTKKPVIENAEFIDSHNKIIRYRRCLLPLDDGSGRVGYVIGCVRWKAFDAHDKESRKEFLWDDPKAK